MYYFVRKKKKEAKDLDFVVVSLRLLAIIILQIKTQSSKSENTLPAANKTERRASLVDSKRESIR